MLQAVIDRPFSLSWCQTRFLAVQAFRPSGRHSDCAGRSEMQYPRPLPYWKVKV